jgi:hypothetical protein
MSVVGALCSLVVALSSIGGLDRFCDSVLSELMVSPSWPPSAALGWLLLAGAGSEGIIAVSILGVRRIRRTRTGDQEVCTSPNDPRSGGGTQ